MKLELERQLWNKDIVDWRCILQFEQETFFLKDWLCEVRNNEECMSDWLADKSRFRLVQIGRGDCVC